MNVEENSNTAAPPSIRCDEYSKETNLNQGQNDLGLEILVESFNKA